MVCACIFLVSCNIKKINSSKDISRHADLLHDLNNGNADSVIAKIPENTQNNNEKIILASAFAQKAGLDIYALLPLLREKIFNGPISDQHRNRDQNRLAKKLLKKIEHKITIKIAYKDVDNILQQLKDFYQEIKRIDKEYFTSRDAKRFKAFLVVLEPKLDAFLSDSREDILALIENAINGIERAIVNSREERETEKHVALELNVGELRKDIVKFMISSLEIIPIVGLTPEVQPSEYYKVDKSIKLLESVVDTGDSGMEKRARSYIVFLSAVMVINNAKTMLDISGDYDGMMCTLDENKIHNFLSRTEKYFISLNKAAQNLSEANNESTFVKISESSAKLLKMEKELKDLSVKALIKVIELEKKRICEYVNTTPN